MSTVQQEVYETLRGQLLAGHYKPGQKLVEQRLASQLGVNRNPVREALLKLAGEGFLQRQAGTGCRVAKVDFELFRDAWQLRESVEGMAARLAAERIQPVQLIRLEHQVDLMGRLAKPGHNSDLIEADNAFHLMLLEFSGNKALREVWRQYLVRIVAMQLMFMPTNYVPPVTAHDESARGHRAIIAALKAHDADAAERAARQHLADSLSEMLSLWSEADRKKIVENKEPDDDN